MLKIANSTITIKHPDRTACTYELLEDYIELIKVLGAIYIAKVDADYYDRLADEIQLENARVIIEERWDIINKSPDSGLSFIEIFNDFFTNCIDKYTDRYFYPLKYTDGLCRAVRGWGHNTDRFVPWPNKAQNRWNPPGKTYLYLSFSERPQMYSIDLSINEYVCLEEIRAEKGEEYSFCTFEACSTGKILYLSYNDVDLSFIKRSLDVEGGSIKRRVMTKDGALGFYLLIAVSVAWFGICYLFIRTCVRKNVLDADIYVAQCGYGEALCLYIDQMMPERLPTRYKLLELGHPSIDEQIACMQAEGVKYSC